MSKIEWALKNALRFSDLALATSWSLGCEKIHLVVLGDDGRFWVCRASDAERLVRAGYEYAN